MLRSAQTTLAGRHSPRVARAVGPACGRVLTALGLLGLLPVLGGCFAAGDPQIIPPAASSERLPASQSAPASATPATAAWLRAEAWPARWGALPTAPVPREGTPASVPESGRTSPPRSPDPRAMGVIEQLAGPVVALRQYEDQKREVEQEMLRDISTLLAARGRGWFRRTPTVTLSGEGRGAFVFTPDTTAEPDRVKSATEPALYFKFISGSRDDWGDRVRIQRTWFAYYEPVGYGPFDQRSPAPARGLVVVLPGLFGTPVPSVHQIVHAFRDRGFAVLRMLSHPSRFTEEATWVLGSDDDIEPLAASIAQELGDRAAECGYAVEAAIAALEQERPALRGAPRVAVGLSGGAMVLPTVVARQPRPWAAAVFIGGGVDFLDIALRSNYSSWIDALRFRRSDGDPLGPDQQARLVAAYRERAPLDPIHTIAALAGTPMLMLHASGDLAVPADLGDLLWTLAGKPERWTFNTGHELLFLALPLHLPRIVAWAESALGPPPPSPKP